MRIDTNVISLLNQFKRDKPESGFDHFLAPEIQSTKSDEYYWQHQAQLQQSALTFQEVISQAKSSSEPMHDLEKTHTTSKPSEDPSPLISHISMHIEQFTPESTMPFKLNIQELITHLEKTTSVFVTSIDYKRSEQLESKSQRITKLMPSATSPSTHKNFQLFIDDQQVELTLNINQLTKRQMTELQKSLQHWLKQKGYTLKQLVINGETQ